MRRRNRSALLRLLLEHGLATRSDLASMTGLTVASVSRIAAELTRCGLIRETKSDGILRAGRRPSLLGLDPMRVYVAAIHVGVRYVDVGLFNVCAGLLRRARREHATASPVDSLELAAGAVEALIRDVGLARANLAAVGLGTGGWVNPHSGVIRLHPRLEWRDVPARQLLEERLRVVATVDASVNSMALAEARFGVGKGAGSLLLLMVGNIIGVGVAIDGHIYYGAHHRAGQVGHTPVDEDGPLCGCGNRGCLEAVAADSVLVSDAMRLGALPPDPPPTIDDVLVAAEAAPGPARDLVTRRATLLGRVVGGLVNLYDPEVVVLAGSTALAPSVQIPALRDEALRLIFPSDHPSLRIETSSFGADAGLAGAAAIALDTLFSPQLDVVMGPDRHIRPVLIGRAAAEWMA